MVAQSHFRSRMLFMLILSVLPLIYSQSLTSEDDFPTFQEYVRSYNKSYENGQYGKRQKAYYQNLQYLRRNKCPGCGINIFTDCSDKDMEAYKGAHQTDIQGGQQIQSFSSVFASGITLTDKTPSSFDWRDKNAVTPVKNQRSCGSCWAFSTTAFFQSDLIINHNYTNKIDLSQQFLIRCDNRSMKCDGGFLFWAMQRIITQGGMPTEKQHPYDYFDLYKEDGLCYETDIIPINPDSRLVSFYEVEDPSFIQKMILRKPVNVNICSKDLQYYAPTNDSRTLKCTSGQTKRDHTVLLVGYTQTQWIIKNQWSTSWGVKGYAYITKDPVTDCCIGKQLFTTGTLSTQCSVDNCEICVQEDSCFQCRVNYYVANVNSKHVCKRCVQPYCGRCVNFFGVCDKCWDGYAVTYPFYKCQKATVEHCSLMYNGMCNECHEGWVLSQDGNCIDASKLCYVTGCEKCVNGSLTKCETCAKGFEMNLETKQCQKKPQCQIQNCSRCSVTNSQFCQICDTQSYTFNQELKKCVPPCTIANCQTCSYSSAQVITCQKCLNSFELSTDNKTCHRCQIQYCQKCSLLDEKLCQQCFNGFYFSNDDKQCKTCSQRIDHCVSCQQGSLNNDSQIKCHKCAYGFTVDKDGLKCLKCLGGCVNCDHGSLAVCSEDCGMGNFFDATICRSCSSNCIQCQNSETCTKCDSKYQLRQGKCYLMCKYIHGKCAKCSSTKCAQCMIGYRLSNGSCIKDENNSCLKENGETPSSSCATCPQQYYMKEQGDGNICDKCQTQDANCVQCQELSPGNCSKCKESFYLEEKQNKCLACSTFDQNCLECEGKADCTRCVDGFYLLSEKQNDEQAGKCSKCSEGCATCRYNSEYCTSCKQGYELTVEKKCMRTIMVKFSIKIDADFDAALNSFLISIYSDLSKLFQVALEQIQITNLSKGSIFAEGKACMPSTQTDSNAFLQRTRQALYGQSSLSSYPLLSTQLQLISPQSNNSTSNNTTTNNSTQDQSPNSDQSREPLTTNTAFDSKGLSQGVILGIAIGGGAFALICVGIIIFAVRKYICNKEQMKKDVHMGEQKVEGQEVDNKVKKEKKHHKHHQNHHKHPQNYSRKVNTQEPQHQRKQVKQTDHKPSKHDPNNQIAKDQHKNVAQGQQSYNPINGNNPI